jgi:hypothetical protein
VAHALFPIVDFLHACVTWDSVVFLVNLELVTIIATEMEFVSMNRAFAIPGIMELIVLCSTLSGHFKLKIVFLVVLVTVVA